MQTEAPQIAELKDAFMMLEGLFMAINLDGADSYELARAGRHIALDYASKCDEFMKAEVAA